MATQPLSHQAHEAIGSFRTFGEYGPMYQVIGPASASQDGEPRVAILVIESGETLDYDLEAYW